MTLRVVSSARRVRQAAPNGSLVYLLDRFDNRYDVTERGQLAFEKVFAAQPALSRKLDPASFFLMTRVFEVPREAGSSFLPIVMEPDFRESSSLATAFASHGLFDCGCSVQHS